MALAVCLRCALPGVLSEGSGAVVGCSLLASAWWGPLVCEGVKT